MKKLVLKGSITEMLTRAQMKQVIGGTTCTATCANKSTVTCTGITICDATDYSDDGDGWCASESGHTNC